MIIAFEGLNGSGKSSTINELQNLLQFAGIESLVVKAPDYDGLHGKEILEYLKGNLNLTFDEIDALFKENRMCIQKDKIIPAVQNNKIILLDRWSFSAQVYALMRNQQIEESYLQKLIENEAIPDITLYLECDVQTIQERLNRRNQQMMPYSLENLQLANMYFQKLKKNIPNIIQIDNNNPIKDTIFTCFSSVIQKYNEYLQQKSE